MKGDRGMQYHLIEIESLEKANILYVSRTKEEMKKFTVALAKANANYTGNLVVVTYDGE